MVTPPTLKQHFARKVVKGVIQGDPDARRRRRVVDERLDREVPKDAQLAEDLEKLKHVQTREEFEQIAGRIQERATKVGRGIGKKYPKRVLGLKIAGVSRQLGASEAAAHASRLMAEKTNAVEEHMKAIEAIQAKSIEALKSDFARAEELRQQGKTSEAKRLQDSAKQKLGYMGAKVQKAYSADALGDESSAVKHLERLYHHESWNAKTHAEGARRQDLAGRRAQELTTASQSMDAETLGMKFQQLAEAGADKLSPVRQSAQTPPNIRRASGIDNVSTSAAVLPPKTPPRLTAAEIEFENRVAHADHLGAAATVGGMPTLAHDASVELQGVQAAGDNVRAEKDMLSVEGREAQKKMHNLVQSLGQDCGDQSVTEADARKAAENIKESHSEVLGDVSVDDILKTAADDQKNMTYAWLSREVKIVREQGRDGELKVA